MASKRNRISRELTEFQSAIIEGYFLETGVSKSDLLGISIQQWIAKLSVEELNRYLAKGKEKISKLS